MKTLLLLIFGLAFIGFLYALAYVCHYCLAEWHCGVDIIMLTLGVMASIMCIFYVFVEMD